MPLHICRKCKEQKFTSDMHYNSGDYTECKDCWNIYCRAQRALLTPEQKAERTKKQIQYRNKRIQENPSYRRDLNLKAKYGITPDDYKEMFNNQNGVCIICKNAQLDNRPLDVDHNHKTNEVRDLLCYKCNSALGLINDNVNILLEMVNYLIRHSNVEQEFIFQHD